MINKPIPTLYKYKPYCKTCAHWFTGNGCSGKMQQECDREKDYQKAKKIIGGLSLTQIEGGALSLQGKTNE